MNQNTLCTFPNLPTPTGDMPVLRVHSWDVLIRPYDCHRRPGTRCGRVHPVRPPVPGVCGAGDGAGRLPGVYVCCSHNGGMCGEL